ncbi:MAG: segregation/condensation protein A [Patescibacteria group bacterium]
MREAVYTVKQSAFEGPLELLLDLIEQKKLHINDISLAQITDEYIGYIETLGSFPLGSAAHFILIAATLVLLKSRSLLPSLELSEEEKGDIEDLERRLREYKRIKELSVHISRLFNAQVIFTREDVSTFTPVFSPTEEMTCVRFLEAIGSVLRGLPKKEMIPQAIIKKAVSLEEMIKNLSTRIEKGLQTSFREYAHGSLKERSHVIVSFLAVLELVRRGIISVVQKEKFGDILMSKKL